MKKKNFILATIGFLSLLSGVLAFKAQHKFNGFLACYGHVILHDIGVEYNVLLNKPYTTVNTIASSPTLFCTFPGPFAYVAQKVTVNL